jgi:hypothetical protein
MQNLPGLEEFFKDKFHMLDEILGIHSAINADGLIEVTIYYRKDGGPKRRIDFVMAGYIIGDGLATEFFAQEKYDQIKNKLFN